MAGVDEASRLRLYNEVTGLFSAESAATMMQSLPTSQWQDVATKDDVADMATKAELASLRAEVATKVELSEVREGVVALRGEMRAGFAEIDAKLERRSRWMVTWLVSALTALAGVQVALFLAVR